MATGLSYYRLESCHVATRMVSLAMSAMSTAWLAATDDPQVNSPVHALL
jgi:hypothetical protein